MKSCDMHSKFATDVEELGVSGWRFHACAPDTCTVFVTGQGNRAWDPYMIARHPKSVGPHATPTSIQWLV